MTTNTTKKAAGASNTNGLHTHTNGTNSPIDDVPRQASTKPTADPVDLTLTITSADARIDSRTLAQGFGNKHKSVMGLIERYADRFKGLGLLPFKKEVIMGRGQPERYCLLNDDQAYLLLSLSRNSNAVVDLKVRLVKAFGRARLAADMRRTEYLPSLRRLQEVVHAKSANSSNESMVQMNIAKLVNKTVGIEAGQRASAPLGKQAILIVAQQVVTQALEEAVDHHDGYQRAKQSMQTFSALAIHKTLPPSSTVGPT